MKSVFRLAISSLAIWQASGVGVRARNINLQTAIAGPSTVLSIHSVTQSGGLYGQARRVAEWHVGQWNNPSGDLPDFENGATSNGSLAVKIGVSPPPSITITQNGRTLACTIKNGTPKEFDGLVGSNTKINTRNLPSVAPGTSEKLSLASYTNLVQKIDLKVVAGSVLSHQPRCAVSKAVAMVSVVLTNSTVRSTFFFQVILAALNNMPHAVWWARGQRNGRFGYNFPALSEDAPFPIGEERQFNVELLPVLRGLIQNNNVGMDNNLNHWFISGAYFGDAIYGNVEYQTEWGGYRLMYGAAVKTK